MVSIKSLVRNIPLVINPDCNPILCIWFKNLFKPGCIKGSPPPKTCTDLTPHFFTKSAMENKCSSGIMLLFCSLYKAEWHHMQFKVHLPVGSIHTVIGGKKSFLAHPSSHSLHIKTLSELNGLYLSFHSLILLSFSIEF